MGIIRLNRLLLKGTLSQKAWLLRESWPETLSKLKLGCDTDT